MATEIDEDQVKKILPHRYPMLFVSNVVSEGNGVGRGFWTLPEDHIILAGHYPGNPVFPGNLVAEMAIQVAGVLNVSDGTVPKDIVPVLSESYVKPMGIILPGDRLEAVVTLVSTTRANYTVLVGEVTVAEGFAVFKLVPLSIFLRLIARRMKSRSKSREES